MFKFQVVWVCYVHVCTSVETAFSPTLSLSLCLRVCVCLCVCLSVSLFLPHPHTPSLHFSILYVSLPFECILKLGGMQSDALCLLTEQQRPAGVFPGPSGLPGPCEKWLAQQFLLHHRPHQRGNHSGSRPQNRPRSQRSQSKWSPLLRPPPPPPPPRHTKSLKFCFIWLTAWVLRKTSVSRNKEGSQFLEVLCGNRLIFFFKLRLFGTVSVKKNWVFKKKIF